MTARSRFGVLIVGLTVSLCRPVAAQPPAAKPSVGDVAMAFQLDTMAQNVLRGQQIELAQWRQSAAMLEAAARLDPGNPRYYRLLADAERQIKDDPKAIDRAIAALSAYRKLRPDDRSAQIDSINLYMGKMEKADEKLTYLSSIVGLEQVPADVRAYVAVRAAELHRERSDPPAADQMIKTALKLDPLNLEAITQSQDSLLADAPLPQRIGLWLSLLRSNPGQIKIMAGLASELAAHGLHAESLVWYDAAAGVAQRLTGAVPAEFAAEYAICLDMAGQPQTGQALADNIIKSNPTDYGSQILRLVQERRAGRQDEANKFRAAAYGALIMRLAAIRTELGVRNATTQPADPTVAAIPDLAGDLELLKKANEPLQMAYVSAVRELGWFEVYFAGEVGEARKITEMLSRVLVPESVDIARLQGWCYLAEGRTEQARVKLSGIADKDMPSALGMLRLYASPVDDAKIKELGLRLLRENRAGIAGLIVRDAVRDKNLTAEPSPVADEIRKELAAFPQGFLKVLEQPQTFYVLKAEPLKVSHAFGEPILVRVTIQNVSDYELTIGKDGLIQPGLWFDASLPQFRELLPQQPLTGVVYDRVEQFGRLRPRQTISQIVRVDQGMLLGFCVSLPSPSISIMMSLRTNPTVVDGQVLSMPGGYSSQFSKPIERAGFAPGPEASSRMTKAVSSGPVDERIRAAYLMSMFVSQLRPQLKQAQEQNQAEAVTNLQNVIDTFTESLRRASEDPDANVRGWAQFLFALQSTDEGRLTVAKQMLADREWRVRVLGLAVVPSLNPDSQKQLAKAAESDEEPLVKRLAAGVLESAVTAQTRPTTIPASPLDLPGPMSRPAAP